MKSLKKERVSLLVTDAIKEIIDSEHLKPGDKLYSENELANKLEVSRSSVREAVRMLEVTGIVKVFQGKGIFISAPEENDCPIRSWVVDNMELLKEHFEVRLLIEPHAASLAAKWAGKEALAELAAHYSLFCDFVRQKNLVEAIEKDSAFHLLIAKMTKNRTLSVLMNTMTKTLNEGWFASLNMPGRLERTVDEHGEILKALQVGDGVAAARHMTGHLHNALEDIKAYTHI
ncbi:FadR/GntR family transcriptional regulator [Sediminispirochaeta smaragdinae]|uniref:GntR domain protein n=1 Tax=Sediminispirochaeta smaragdinae (strain DSM 11293 / JCM 15392 / SEBR 4228) TaxID=573413 RepID=E1RAM5_SEDSS|nr:FCD domain-containing protein [Sediminispirochaeta smaragdinae]ADK82393.1 GntR domain protein [Sediminispirochaeta smaragdinae DSM 11293]